MEPQSTEPKLPPPVPAHDLFHVLDLVRRLSLHGAVKPLPTVLVWSIYVFVNGFISIALLAVLAVCTGVPFVFPSLGPTAYLLFFSPRAEASSPRNTIIGHAIGLVCGYGAFELLGRPLAAAVGHGGFDWPRVIAAALSLAATGALMVLFKAGHPPAGATTLIVSLGIIYKPWHLVVVMIAVVILTIQAWCINRLAGLPVPLWRARQSSNATTPPASRTT
jgi:CBS domain-containing membrane protein